MKQYKKLEKIKKKITEYFNSLTQKIYTINELGKILHEQRKSWKLSTGTTRRSFIEYLLLRTKLENHILKFPKEEHQRFTWGPGSIYSIVLSLKKNLHFTHHTAVYLHNLREKIPKGVFATVEQSPKKTTYQLSQLDIDNAMSKPQRITRNIASFGRHDIYLLNGKHTENMGIIEGETTTGEKMLVTDLERTLIDITVRPEYSGGVFEVLDVFKRAATDVSCEKLVQYLNRLNYIYPYHQCIGYYMEMSKVYRRDQMALFREINRDYDFFLSHNILNGEYSERWKLFYPIEMTFL